jgi:hypothetical protein
MITGWARAIFIVLIMLSVGYCAIWQSGDGGEQFAIDTAESQCQEENVQAVYMCLGNIVKVVSTEPGEGSTFYKPDGKVVHCPVVAPPEMGAECLQLMMSNYCPEEAECGESAPQIFPGQNDSPEETGDADYYIVEGEAASDELEEPEEVLEPTPVVEPPKKKSPKLDEPNEEDIPAATPGSLEFALSNLIWMVLFLGLVTVGILFVMFKKSVNEEL